MPYKTPGRGEMIEVQARRERVQDIFPDRITWAAVNKACICAHFQVRWKRTQEVHVVRAQDTFMIFKRAARIAIERLKGNLAEHSHIVVSEQTCEVRDLA